MKHGFIKVSAVTPKITVADPAGNADIIIKEIKESSGSHSKVIVLPELCISGYECRDLFWQEFLLNKCIDALFKIREETKDIDAIIFVGLPLEYNGKLFNVAAALCKGEILGFVPKKNLPNYNEFYEARHFSQGNEEVGYINLKGETIPFGTNIIFECSSMPHLKISAEICEDLWAPEPPSVSHALAGATMIVNLSASDAMTGKASYRKGLVS